MPRNTDNIFDEYNSEFWRGGLMGPTDAAVGAPLLAVMTPVTVTMAFGGAAGIATGAAAVVCAVLVTRAYNYAAQASHPITERLGKVFVGAVVLANLGCLIHHNESRKAAAAPQAANAPAQTTAPSAKP